MTILASQINPIGQSGIMPNIIFLSVNNTFDQITEPGYLNTFISSGGNRISPLDIALVAYSIIVNTTPTQTGFFVINFSDGNWTLIPYYGAGTVFNVTASVPLTSTQGSSPNIALSPSGVDIGTYSNANITLDLYGRVTSAGNGVPSGVISVTASTPISSTGGNAPNISISPSGVSAGTYTNTTLTVNSSGLVTAANSGTAPLTNITVSSPLSSTGGTTPTITVSPSGVSAGTYTFGTFTVNNQGIVTSAANGSPGTVTSVSATSPLNSTGGANPTISISAPIPVASGGTGETSLTAGAVLIGNGSSPVSTLAMTNGQLLIGITGSAPNSTSLTASTGILVSGGSGTLAVGISSPIVVGIGGTGLTSVSSYCMIFGGTTSTGAFQVLSGTGTSGQVITSSGANALPFWATPSGGGGGLTVSAVTTSTVQMSTNTRYIVANSAGLCTLTLPTTYAQGDTIQVRGTTSSGWLIAQNSGQIIFFGTDFSTSGNTGSIASKNQYDNIWLESISAGASGGWLVAGAVGNLTVT